MAMLGRAGHQAFYVGGCVRDAVLGLPVGDIDIATDASPEEVTALARAAGIKAVPTGVEHGTVTLVHGRPLEITTFRRDVETDGRRAVVAFSGSVEEDAARRDFTMNALYADAAGEVMDPIGGLEDALARHLRFIGSAQDRIREDYLRSLRYFRFYARFADPAQGPDPEALAAIAANLSGLDTLSAERVGHEVRKMLATPDPAPAVALMASTGVLAHILPGADPRALAPLVHIEVGAGVAPEPIRRLAALGGENVADRLRLSRAEARDLAALVEGIGMGPGEAGYRLGAKLGRDAVLLKHAFAGTEPDPETAGRIAEGAAAKFPVRAADLAPLTGAELGGRLKEIEARWIASGFRLTRTQLLG
jgi:poly(A) polymerase